MAQKLYQSIGAKLDMAIGEKIKLCKSVFNGLKTQKRIQRRTQKKIRIKLKEIIQKKTQKREFKKIEKKTQ